MKKQGIMNYIERHTWAQVALAVAYWAILAAAVVAGQFHYLWNLTKEAGV